jgi:hypothetical protein
LPWSIGILDGWSAPFPGVSFVVEEIRILVIAVFTICEILNTGKSAIITVFENKEPS